MAYICNEMEDFFAPASDFVLVEVPDDFDSLDGDIDDVPHNVYKWDEAIRGFILEEDGGLVGGSQYFYHEESDNFLCPINSVLIDLDDIFESLEKHGIPAEQLQPIDSDGSRSLDLSILDNIDNIEDKRFGWDEKLRSFSVAYGI
ncbi:MAG: hypothetical protein ACOYMG_11640 [Candidatus Methylumidiphilus sp.]